MTHHNNKCIMIYDLKEKFIILVINYLDNFDLPVVKAWSTVRKEYIMIYTF